MANPISAIARLFKRKPQNALVGELYSRGIGRPLLAHADMGALVLKGFLANPNMPESDLMEHEPEIVDGIAVLDISGALVNRPMGFCSPLSYAEITHEFNTLIEDDGVNTIVLRLDSAGGEAAGMFDLADHIHANRGIKPIIAVVDDMAYSAAFGIASAADEIVLSRTGGVGSVGVVSYHIDQSEHNQKQGIKVEYLFAGDRKVDGNPHEELTETARDSMQGEINRLYGLFVSTVARNRSMTEEAVRATQAACFHGEQAINAGLADRIGTFSDVINGLLSPQASSQVATKSAPEKPAGLVDQSTGAAQSVASEATKEATADTAEITLPQAAGALPDDNIINTSSSVAQLVLTDAEQAEIKAMCAAAGLPDVASDYITAGTSPAQVRADLFAVVSMTEQEISTAEPVAMPNTQPKHSTAADIYAQRKQFKK